ncbi:MAG: NADPH-dependent 7-cyano-7-deazaguanine reductase QueF [Candidatus Tectomicrobia bacterium]|nr:NADPH-dependent 7-cyano-7-deazaguanine reductase QueF [Candidatus Tectomicrobia bacterium]
MEEKAKRYGEEAIERAQLESIPNLYPDRDYEISISCPEFTCLCPISGYPDFAVISITYVPDQRCVELKSLKLYINKFRNQHLFHEQVVNLIRDDLVQALQPRRLSVEGDFNRRGNIKTIIRSHYPSA